MRALRHVSNLTLVRKPSLILVNLSSQARDPSLDPGDLGGELLAPRFETLALDFAALKLALLFLDPPLLLFKLLQPCSAAPVCQGFQPGTRWTAVA